MLSIFERITETIEAGEGDKPGVNNRIDDI